MRTRNPNYRRADAAIEGRVSPRRAGSRGLTFRDATVEAHPVTDVTFLGANVTDNNDGSIIVTVAQGSTFVPEATITATKASGNPTFNFNALVENMIKVGSTYYCPYIVAAQTTVRIATATDRDGPWTDAGQIYALTSIGWKPAGVDVLYAPFLIEDSGTFYLFYAICKGSDGTLGYIGYATSSTVDGTYTDHGAAILSPGSGWDARRVAEPAVMVRAGVWYMAYMGESLSGVSSESEKLGLATAPLPSGPWTKAGGNPIPWGASGEWDSVLMADPDLFWADGYFWIWYVGMSNLSPTSDSYEGLLYTADATGTWTRFAGNPVLLTGATGWDSKRVFRGGMYFEDGQWGGVYSGTDDITTLANYKGGNFRLSIVSQAVAPIPTAGEIDISDTGGYYTGTEVETALQEIGATFASLDLGGGGHYEAIVSGTAPPVAVTNTDDDDWIYGFLAD